jgi:hypothetical protein
LLDGCASSARLEALRAENARLRSQLAERREPQVRAKTDRSDRSVAAVDWQSFPIGDTWIPWTKSATLGWARMRVRSVRQCEGGSVGVELEIQNDSAKQLHGSDLERAATLVVGGKRQPSALSFDPNCENRGAGEIPPGAADKVWLTFKGEAERAELLQLSLDEPEGLAHHELAFGLRDGIRAPARRDKGRVQASRPAPERQRIGEPVETPYFRVTLVGKKLCQPSVDADGKLSVGIELLFENFSNVDFEVGESGKLKDTKGYEYSNDRPAYLGACEPRLSHARVEPGQRVRGWLFPFVVPVDAANLTLSYWVSRTTFMSGMTSVALPIGSLPKAEKGVTPVAAPDHWTQPASTSLAGTGYAIRVTNLKACSAKVENGKMWLGVELRLDNRKATDLVLPSSFSLKDDKGYSYPYEAYNFGDATPCQPSLGYEPVKPGDKARGWIAAFRVPVGVGRLVLQTSIRWEPARGSRDPLDEQDVTLPIGELDAR